MILYSGGAGGCGARRAVREGERWIRIGGARVTAASVQCVSRCRACLSEIQNQPVRTDVAGRKKNDFFFSQERTGHFGR